MARFVLHPDALGQVDVKPLLRELALDVVRDAQRIVPVDTGQLRNTLRVDEVTDRSARVAAGDPSVGVDYALFVEQGTSRMRAQPYLRPALYRYRSGR